MRALRRHTWQIRQTAARWRAANRLESDTMTQALFPVIIAGAIGLMAWIPVAQVPVESTTLEWIAKLGAEAIVGVVLVILVWRLIPKMQADYLDSLTEIVARYEAREKAMCDKMDAFSETLNDLRIQCERRGHTHHTE